jgi:hypothetical protein
VQQVEASVENSERRAKDRSSRQGIDVDTTPRVGALSTLVLMLVLA